jgi:hypothetical protein
MAGQPDIAGCKFDFTNMNVTELGIGIQEPQTIFEATRDFDMQATIEFSGVVAEAMNNAWALLVDGTGTKIIHWVFTVTAESFGTAPEVTLDTQEGELNVGQFTYGPGHPAPVPTVHGGPTPGNPLTPGVWKLTGLVTFVNTVTGLPPAGGFVGYYEGPVIQVY